MIGAAVVTDGEERPGALAPFFRILLVAFGTLAVARLLYGFAVSPTRLSILWGIALGAVALLLLGHAIHPKRKLFTPVPFALFFLLGYVLSLGGLVEDPASVPRVGFGALGRFDFTNGAMAWPMEVVLAGVAGIVAATYVGERLLLPAFGAAPPRAPRVSSQVVAGGWLAITVGLVGACATLGLGRTGLGNETSLPFALGGLLVFMRDLVVPGLTGFALYLAVREGRSRMALAIIVLAFALGVFDSLVSLSRGRFVGALIPIFVVAIQRDEAVRRFRKLGVPVFLGLLLLSATVIGAINGMRVQAYSSGQTSAAEAVEQFESRSTGDVEEESGWEKVATLATDRVGGARELLAISSCRSRGEDAAWGLVTGDGPWVDRVTRESFGFIPLTNRTLGQGVGFGFWGPSSLVDSLPFVFLATMLLALLPMLVEILFIRFADRIAGQVLAVLLALSLWGQPATFQLSRFAFVALLVLVGLGLLLPALRAPRGRAPVAGASELPVDPV